MSELVDIPHVIDGEERPAADGRTFESVNPATEAAWARVARGSAADAAAAVAAARRAFDAGPWPRMAPAERGAALRRLADLIEEQAGSLGRLDATDMGKPIRQARDNDAHRAALNFRFFADYAALAADEALPSPTGHHVYTRHEPVGVAAAISPWNFPLMLASWKVAPALAFGNTVVLKPAEQSPASCHRLGLLAGQAGLPPGTLNVVQGFGPGEAGQALTEDPGVDLITFTGESATGRAILAAGAPTLKRVSFELGGKGANLVFADADLANAVEWSLRAIFLNAGQVCLSGSRLYVQRPVYDEFLERFVAGAEAMRLGDPLDEATEVGPLASHEHWRKVTGYLDLAAAEGAKVRTGGRGRRLVGAAHRAGRRPPGHGGLPRGDLRPGGRRPALRHRRGGGGPGQRLGLRPQRHGVHREPAPRPPGRGRGPGGDDLGQLLLRPRPAGPVRGLQGLRHRPRGRRLQPRVLHRGQGGGHAVVTDGTAGRCGTALPAGAGRRSMVATPAIRRR